MNIKNVMMMAAMMPAFALAETNSNCTPASVEANDTTIRVNDQNIVIKQDGEQTSVKIYKSLVYKNHATEIAHYLKSDRKAAKKIREVVENGKMVSGYYMMAPLSNGNNRFILFSNPSKSKGTVIYIEGDLSPEDIMQLCYSRR